jgi:mRNA interferase RelE/StbE
VASYSVVIKPTAARELEAVPRKGDRRRIVERIAALADDPRPPGALKLSGHERYRFRLGPFRVVYGIDEAGRVVLVVKIGHRKDVYRGSL